MNNKQNNIFEKNPLKTLIVILFAAMIIIDFIVANIYILITGHGFFEEPYNVIARNERSFRIKSDIYHHDLAKKTFVRSAHWGPIEYSISTDSLGFKSKHVKDTPLSTDNKRIVFIGDSFTEGVGVEYPNTFAGLISSRLELDDVNVLNAGVVSYSPTIYWRKIKYLLEDVGLEFDELVVFIDISDIQDEAMYYWLSESETVEGLRFLKGSSDSIKRFIKNHTLITYFTLNKLHDLFLSQNKVSDDNKPDYNYQRTMWTVDKNAFEEVGKKGLEKSEYFMDLLAKLTKKHSIKLTVAVYPWREQIKNHDLDSIQVSFWKKWANKRNVTFLNYFPCFIEPKSTDVKLSNTIDKYFLVGDGHWNKAGHNLIAENFLSFYTNNYNVNNNSCIEVVH